MVERQKKHRSYFSSVESRKDPDPSEDFKQRFPERYLVRFHMTLLLLGVSVSGLLASKILLEFGLRSMFVRYLIAVCVAYAVFFFLIRIWLWYVHASSKEDDPPVPDLDIVDAIDLTGISVDSVQGGAGIDEVSNVGLSGTGGDFGGGGATDMWGNASTVSGSAPSPLRSSGGGGSSGKSGGWDFDLGDEAIVLLVLGLLLLVIFGAGAYLVYAAPEILTEAAFQALLAAGLIKASSKITRRGWIGSVLRATCIPFLVVLLMTGIFGWVAQKNYPHASRLADIFSHSTPEKR
jgi:hypothetical protein